MEISSEEIMGLENIKHEFCTRKAYDIRMRLLCFTCGTIKEKLGLDPRKRIGPCQLM